MIATRTNDLLRRLRKGTPDKSDEGFLEQVKVSEWVDELRSFFPITFQERHIRSKSEVSLARSIRTELAARPIPESALVSLAAIPVYVNCVMINIEDDTITAISTISRIAVRAVARPVPGLIVTSGRGFKLDKLDDSWVLKPQRNNTVRLSEDFLKTRGWRFDCLTRYVPTM
jgi:hypothetical protein